MSTNKVIYVALTIDDGPRRGPSEEFAQLLKANRIPATWYIVKSNVEQYGSSRFYQHAQDLVSNGHEFAIHEALPRNEANRSILYPPRRGGGDPTEHVPPFPTSRFWSYRNNDNWGAHLHQFSAELKSNLGVAPKFVRLPGGLITELFDYRRFMGVGFSASSLIAWINRTYNSGVEYSENEKINSLARVVGTRRLYSIYHKVNDFMKWMDHSDLKLWGGGTIRGSARRTASNERYIATQFISPQSWTAEIAPSRNNATYVIARRFRRFRADGRINDSIAPYVVVLTHDNPGYFNNFRRTLSNIQNLHQVRDGEIRLEFVTMSELYKQVENDPLNR